MKKNKLSIFILLFLIITVFYPLLCMLVQVDWSKFTYLISMQVFKDALTNSLVITSISTIISILLAYILAYTINRCNIKHRNVIKIFLTLPMLIPSISHGIGLINLFGANGLISKIFNFNIVGPVGIVLGSIMYSFPVAFLMLDDGFKYIDNNMYINAKVLGLSKLQTFTKVTLCYLKKPLVSSVFAVFTLIFTDYGVPLAIGGKYTTLPVFLYKEVLGLLDYSKGTMIGLFLLIPAFISFIFDNFSKDYSSCEDNNNYNISINKVRDIIFNIFTVIILLFIFIVIGSFIYYAFLDNPFLNRTLSFKHFQYVFNNRLGSYILNSLIIALFTSMIGTIISYFAAYITARTEGKFSKFIHILAISSLAIPGLILGLSYNISFKNSFISNTFFILILVNITHFMASPYLLAYNALKKVDSNYEVVAKTCNINFIRILVDVIIPCTKSTIREMFAYFFVNSMITISAIAFLFNTRTMPLSLLINDYEGNMMLGEAAIISLIILLINFIVKSVVYVLNKRDLKKNF